MQKLELIASSSFYVGLILYQGESQKVLGRPNTFSIIHFLQLQID